MRERRRSMVKTQAPYGLTTELMRSFFVDRDRQRQRLMARMWDVVNRRKEAPILHIYKIVPKALQLEINRQVEEQPWLPLHHFTLPEWFVRIVNTTIVWSTTSTGETTVDELHQQNSTKYKVVKKWCEEMQHARVHELAHECCNQCRIPNYAMYFGLTIFCHYTKQPPVRTAAVYATLTWLQSADGRELVQRHRDACSRLVTYRDILGKNEQKKGAE